MTLSLDFAKALAAKRAAEADRLTALAATVPHPGEKARLLAMADARKAA